MLFCRLYNIHPLLAADDVRLTHQKISRGPTLALHSNASHAGTGVTYTVIRNYALFDFKRKKAHPVLKGMTTCLTKWRVVLAENHLRHCLNSTLGETRTIDSQRSGSLQRNDPLEYFGILDVLAHNSFSTKSQLTQ